MSSILALETSGEICSVALLLGDEVTQRVCETPRQHLQHLLPFVDALLAEGGISMTNLDGIAFSRGPGSFTGLRIAASAAQGLAFGSGLPVVPVSTLQTLAQTAHRQTGASRVLAVLDARMDEVYSGWFEWNDGIMRGVGEERLSSRAQVKGSGSIDASSGAWMGAGSGWNRPDEFQPELCEKAQHVVAELQPLAWDVCMLAQRGLAEGAACAPADAQPVYIRDKVAELPKRR